MNRRCRGWLFGIALAACLVWTQSQVGANEFRRGIALSHVMAWAAVEPAPSKAFAFPPFADRELRTAELQSLRRAGFDFVRLAVDPGPFLQFRGARRDMLDQMLLDRVRVILSSGLAVMVDFHPSDMHPHYVARALTSGLGRPPAQDFLQLVEHTAGLLDGLQSQRVALELFNEPPGATEAWQAMLEAAYRAARKRAPMLLLVLTGAHEGSPDGLTTLRTAAFRNDPAVLYTFHYYAPFQFTHQGASWNPAHYLTDVPYPASARPLGVSLAATLAAIEAAGLAPSEKVNAAAEARRHLESYRRSGFDRAAIGRDLDGVMQWARGRGVASSQLLLGEFGAMKSDRQSTGTRAIERRQWFADVRLEAETRGFGWAVWAYRGAGGFSLVPDERASDVDPGLIEALGLAPPHRRDAAPAN
jgi:hypothetical protein